jgi:hypothetical protein
VDGRMTQGIDRAELDRFEKRMDAYAKVSDFKDHTTEIAPMVTEASYLIKKCAADNQDMREIIVRYDEILCTKLDKASMIELKLNIQKRFPTKEQLDSFVKSQGKS